MELSNDTLEKIGSYVKRNLAGWIRETGVQVTQTDPALLERAVRVEEELRSQRELLDRSLAMAEARAAQVDRRFDQVDKRIDQQREEMVARFDQVDKRFDQVDRRIDQQREEMVARFDQVDKRFEQVDKRFDQQREEMTARFAHTDRSLVVLTVMLGFIGLVVTAIGIVLAASTFG